MKFKYGKVTVYLCYYSKEGTDTYALVSRSKKCTQKFKVNTNELNPV